MQIYPQRPGCRGFCDLLIFIQVPSQNNLILAEILDGKVSGISNKGIIIIPSRFHYFEACPMAQNLSTQVLCSSSFCVPSYLISIICMFLALGLILLIPLLDNIYVTLTAATLGKRLKAYLCNNSSIKIFISHGA